MSSMENDYQLFFYFQNNTDFFWVLILHKYWNRTGIKKKIVQNKLDVQDERINTKEEPKK